MASQGGVSLNAEAERQSSAVVAAGLSSEDDAAALGMAKTQDKSVFCLETDNWISKTWVQARAASQLYYDRGLRDRLLNHGSLAVYCLNTRLFDTGRPCGYGLGALIHASSPQYQTASLIVPRRAGSWLPDVYSLLVWLWWVHALP